MQFSPLNTPNNPNMGTCLQNIPPIINPGNINNNPNNVNSQQNFNNQNQQNNNNGNFQRFNQMGNTFNIINNKIMPNKFSNLI